MIAFTERAGVLGPILTAEGRQYAEREGTVVITSGLGGMDTVARRRQALALIDAAASLLDDDDECAEQFEALHAVLEGLPVEVEPA